MNPIRQKLHTLIDELVDLVESVPAKDEMLDSKHSPLGPARHRALARAGKLPSVKDGRRVLIRRSDIEAYLAKNKRVVADPSVDLDADAIRILSEMQRTG